MAPPKKRQKSSPTTSHPQAASELMLRKKKMSVTELDQSDCEAQPAEHLFRKLPGELRNNIYDLVLPEGSDQIHVPPPPEDLIGKLPGEIRNAIYKVLAPSCAVAADQPDATCVRYGTWRPSSTRPNKYIRWEEPSLLAAVKWIRLEARQVYFQSPIEIAVTTSEIKPACEWLRTVAQSDDDGKCLGRVTFWLSSGSWEDMQSWLPLAQLLREYRFGRPRKRYEEQEGPRASEHVPEVKVVYERHHRIAAALNEVIALGIEAREQDWSNTELEFAYWNWMDGKSNRLLSRKSRQRRSALA
ncbi:hypothetical protein B0A55_02015 [Friedmanniomyces simplex]|uniref:Uncharacterized protein n=1 Tax=Friedmanniomyces simplex TaxID=329884 RepID=A0A4U0XSG0_9PEZI|nr:hypothetical protein B0A55_02015 [Friedmanniomyces simplex]